MKKQITIINSNIEFNTIVEKGKFGFILDHEFVKLNYSTIPKDIYGYTNIEKCTLDSAESVEKYIHMIEWYINNVENEATLKKLYRLYNKLLKQQEKYALLESDQ